MKVRRNKSKSSSSSSSSGSTTKEVKGTMPNKEKESLAKNSSSGNSSATSMSPINTHNNGPTSSGGTSATTTSTKEVSGRALLAKELEEINKKLTNLSLAKGRKQFGIGGGGGGGTGSGDASSQPENEIKLLEKKLLVLLKMKNWKDVRDEGYKILGKKGPNVIIYKCILVSLCRLGKVGSEFEDDVVELLDHWKKSTPKCSQMQDTKRKMEGFLTAIRSGVDPGSLLQNLQDVLGLNSISTVEASSSEPNWRFRAPPQRHNTFSLCPRISGDSSSVSTCIYGEDCILAHSKEELKEWQIRAQWNKVKSSGGDGMSPVLNLLANGQSHTPPSNLQFSKDKIPQSYRSLPHACMYYLLGLNRKVLEADNIATVFTDSLPDVKFKSTTPLVAKKVFGDTLPLIHKWTFMVASKQPLATVTLYNETNRDFFAITSANFINTKREKIDLIEIHPNNQTQKAIQVLNTFIRPDLFLPFNSGWPEWCCYQIEVTFQTMLYVPKTYDQVIIFDFKQDPKISKKLTICLEEPSKIPQRPIESNVKNFSYAQASNRGFSRSKSLSASDSDDENNSDGELSANMEVSNINSYPKVSSVSKVYNNVCLPTPAQKPIPLMELNALSSAAKTPISKPILTSKPIDSLVLLNPSSPFRELQFTAQDLNRSSYKAWMSLFLRAELRLRQDALTSLSGTVNIKLTKPSPLSNGSSDMCLVGELRLPRDVNKDSKLGRLVLSSCHGMSIRKLSEDVDSKARFCRIIEKLNHPLKISIDDNTVSEFQLSEGTEEKFEICLFLEQSYLPFINSIFHSHSFRDRHLDILFPNFNDGDEWDINSIVQSRIECTVEDKCTLNTKQKEAYQTIVSPPGPANSLIPIILTGPSGSGKSYVIAHSAVKLSLLQSNLGRSNRIAICTSSDSAANQYVTQFLPAFIGNSSLKNDLVPLRIYSEGHDASTIPLGIKKYCVFDETVNGTKCRTPSCQEIYSKRIIVFTIKSCVDLLKIGLLSETFSYIFVDEAECMLEAEAVCPIILAGDSTKVVLSGDSMKLLPEAFLSNYTEFFRDPTVLLRLEKLYPSRHPMKCKLEELYCNHKDIAQFISDEFYNSSLKCAQNQSAQSFPMSFCLVHGGEDSQPEYGEGYYNMPEVYEIRDRILSLVKAWPPSWGSPRDHSIAVLTPYADQAYALRVRLELNGLSFVDVETLPNVIDKRYKAVILSPVRVFKSDQEKIERFTDCGFLTNRRAVYTAFSRAENIIMVVGDLTSLCKHCSEKELWRQYIGLCQRNGSLIGIQNLGIYAPILQSENGFLSADKAEFQSSIQTLAANVASAPGYFLQSHLNMYDMAPTSNQIDPFLARTERVETINNTAINLDRLSSIWDTIPSVNQSNSIRSSKLPEQPDQNKTWEYSSQTSKSNAVGSVSTSSIWNSPSVSAAISLSSTSTGFPSDQATSKIEHDTTEFRNPFDLPDVKLLAEAALSGNNSRARHPPQIQTPFTYTSTSAVPQKSFTTQSRLPTAPQSLSHSSSAYNFPGLPETTNSYSLFNPPMNTLQRSAIAPPSMAHAQAQSNANIMNLASLNQLPRRQGFAPPPRMLNKARPNPMQSGLDMTKELDFFKEMGLFKDSHDRLNSIQTRTQRTLSPTAFTDNKQDASNNESFALDNNEFPSLDTSGNDEWIEVRSSKKSRSPTTKSKTDDQKNKKSKRRSKGDLYSTDVFPGEATPESKEQTVDQKIESLKEMGFEKRHAIRALQMCDKDLARAVEWLILNAPFKKD